MAGLWLYILCFISPLVFCPFTFSSFELPKIVFVRILTAIFLIYGVVKIIAFKKIVIRNVFLLPPFAFFTISLVVSSVLSLNPWYAIFGYYGYFEGILSFLNYFLVYFVLVHIVESKEQTDKVISSVVWSAFFVAIYGLMQTAGKEIIPQWRKTTEARIVSTIGNPMLLGGYLVFVLPLVIERIIAARSLLKLTYFIIFSTTVTCLFLTFTRGAYIALAISFIFIFIDKRLSPYRQKFILIFIILLLTFFIFHKKKSVIDGEEITLINRINPLNFFSTQSTEIRKTVWKGALRIIKEKYFFGVGPDNFPLAYDRYGTKNLAKLTKLSFSSPEKAHNEFLQTTSCFGFFGLWCYLWLLCCIFLSLLKNRDFKSRIIFSSFVAYLVQTQFSYNILPVSLNFYCLVGIVTCLRYFEYPLKVVKIELKKNQTIVVVGSLIVLICFLLWTAVCSFFSDIYFRKGMEFTRKKDWREGEKYFKKAIALFPFEENYYNNLGVAYVSEKKYTLAISTFKKAIKMNPENAVLWNNLGLAFASAGKLSDAKSAFLRGKKFAPHLAEIYFNLGDVFFAEGKTKEAIAEYEYGMKIFPEDAYRNLKLGEFYYVDKNFRKSIFYYRRSLEISPSAIGYNNLGMALMKTEKIDDAIKSFEEAIKLGSRNPEVYTNLGFAKYLVGKLDEAEEYINIALNLSPKNDTVVHILSKIKEKRKKIAKPKQFDKN